MKHINFWSISEYTFSPPDLHCLDPLTGHEAQLVGISNGDVKLLCTQVDPSGAGLTMSLAQALVTLVGLGFPRPPQVHIQRFTALMKEHRPAPSDYMMSQPTT